MVAPAAPVAKVAPALVKVVDAHRRLARRVGVGIVRQRRPPLHGSAVGGAASPSGGLGERTAARLIVCAGAKNAPGVCRNGRFAGFVLLVRARGRRRSRNPRLLAQLTVDRVRFAFVALQQPINVKVCSKCVNAGTRADERREAQRDVTSARKRSSRLCEERCAKRENAVLQSKSTAATQLILEGKKRPRRSPQSKSERTDEEYRRENREMQRERENKGRVVCEEVSGRCPEQH